MYIKMASRINTIFERSIHDRPLSRFFTARDLRNINGVTAIIYGFLCVLNYHTVVAIGNEINSYVVNIMIGQVLFGFLLSIMATIFFHTCPRLDNISTKLCGINIISVHMYSPLCILLFFGFIDFGSNVCILLIFEFGLFTVISSSLYVIYFISKFDTPRICSVEP
jgi:hypothetical protein